MVTERERERETETETETETEKSKTLVLKDSSIRSDWTYLTAVLAILLTHREHANIE